MRKDGLCLSDLSDGSKDTSKWYIVVGGFVGVLVLVVGVCVYFVRRERDCFGAIVERLQYDDLVEDEMEEIHPVECDEDEVDEERPSTSTYVFDVNGIELLALPNVESHSDI